MRDYSKSRVTFRIQATLQSGENPFDMIADAVVSVTVDRPSALLPAGPRAGEDSSIFSSLMGESFRRLEEEVRSKIVAITHPTAAATTPQPWTEWEGFLAKVKTGSPNEHEKPTAL